MATWMNESEIEEAEFLISRNAPQYLPYVHYLMAWRDIVNANSDGWAYWSGGTRPAAKLMELIEEVMDSARGWGKHEALPSQDEFRRAISPIKAAATRHKLPAPAIAGIEPDAGRRR